MRFRRGGGRRRSFSGGRRVFRGRRSTGRRYGRAIKIGYRM